MLCITVTLALSSCDVIEETLGNLGITIPDKDLHDGPGEHEHSFADEWSYDENKHWHAATCEHTGEKTKRQARCAGDFTIGQHSSKRINTRSFSVEIFPI